MSEKKRHSTPDEDVKQIHRALEEGYGKHHPKAKIEVYRYNPAAIRIRILDPDFAGIHEFRREDLIWEIIDKLPEDPASQITLVLLLTPEEAERSHASFEFDNPVPTTL